MSKYKVSNGLKNEVEFILFYVICTSLITLSLGGNVIYTGFFKILSKNTFTAKHEQKQICNLINKLGIIDSKWVTAPTTL